MGVVMTQEDKDLLLRDLCARLPYRVKVQIKNEIVVLDSVCDDDGYHFNFIGDDREGVNVENIKPYLLPLSSMTEEQKNDCPVGETTLNIIKSNIGYGLIEIPWRLSYMFVEWCDKNHFDYRGLIPKGLAIDATGLDIY